MYSANLFIVACFLATNMAIILLNTFPSTSDIHTYIHVVLSSGVISSRLGWPLIRETVTDQYGSLIACSCRDGNTPNKILKLKSFMY